jgi:pyridinium-3,5-bisthiocarboxylic acid mononucleotide nickel chelatase
MKIAYFDCFAGASGDMIVGALIDAGASLSDIENQLSNLGIGDFELSTSKTTRQHIGATKFDVAETKQKVIRTWPSIRKLIEQSDLSTAVKQNSLAIFKRIAEAEAKIHNKPVDQVHFHEVGALDSIIDIVSSAMAIELLGIEKIYSSPVATGTGMVKTEHGMLPVPAPATAELLLGVPIYSSNINNELTTPTGAAILTNYAIFTDEIPGMQLTATGYGAGERELKIPNVLRVLLGEENCVADETAILIETNLDDISPEILGYVMDRLLGLGALDAWFTPIQMKKNRPASMLSVLILPEHEKTVMNLIFSETSTLGLRISRQARKIADRKWITVSTRHGKVKVKVGKYEGAVVSISPEFEDCKKIALENDLPLSLVFEMARVAASKVLN